MDRPYRGRSRRMRSQNSLADNLFVTGFFICIWYFFSCRGRPECGKPTEMETHDSQKYMFFDHGSEALEIANQSLPAEVTSVLGSALTHEAEILSSYDDAVTDLKKVVYSFRFQAQYTLQSCQRYGVPLMTEVMKATRQREDMMKKDLLAALARRIELREQHVRFRTKEDDKYWYVNQREQGGGIFTKMSVKEAICTLSAKKNSELGKPPWFWRKMLMSTAHRKQHEEHRALQHRLEYLCKWMKDVEARAAFINDLCRTSKGVNKTQLERNIRSSEMHWGPFPHAVAGQCEYLETEVLDGARRLVKLADHVMDVTLC